MVSIQAECEECRAEYKLIFDSENFVVPEYCPFCGEQDSMIFYNRKNETD
ncbi:hypothetical protein [Bacillus testis]|nr:hypothetical protein [Bacillus testis]